MQTAVIQQFVDSGGRKQGTDGHPFAKEKSLAFLLSRIDDRPVFHNRNARDHSFSFLDDQFLIRRFRFHSVDDTGGPVQRDGIDLCCWTDSKVKP